MGRSARIALLGLAAVLAGLAMWKQTNAPPPIAAIDTAPPDTCSGVAAAPPPSVWLAELTWEETCAAIAAGFHTVILPTAGIEQNGRHAVLAKHRWVVGAASERIATELGHTLVAPVVDFAPEDRHMGFAGTITVPEPIFEALLDATARSLREHGFTLVAFVGDSYDSQAAQARVAAKLASEWSGGAMHVGDYYARNGQLDLLRSRGETDATIGQHAGLRDTSELLAVRPEGVRRAKLPGAAPDPSSGSSGDASRATAELGEELLRLKVAAAVTQIRAAK